MVYLGSLTNFDLIYAWTQDKCVPLVREITFENGEVRIFYTILLLGFLSQNQSVSFKVSNPRQRTFCMLCFHRNTCQIMSFLSSGVFWLDLKFTGGRLVVVSYTAKIRSYNHTQRLRKKCLVICRVWTLVCKECVWWYVHMVV